MNEHELVKLTKADEEAISRRIEAAKTEIEARARLELQTVEAANADLMRDLGDKPTMRDLYSEGLKDAWYVPVLDAIAATGRVVTLAIGEFIRTFALPVLAVALIALEADRVTAGFMALGHDRQKALLVAVAFTAFNFFLPIYRLRNLQGVDHVTVKRWTLRGHFMAFVRRVTGQPTLEEHRIHDNPALQITETAITWATLSLAIFSVLAPMMADYAGVAWYQTLGAVIAESTMLEMLGLIAGTLIAIGGVFGVQSIGHELGVRYFLDQNRRVSDVLQERRAAYEERRARITAQRSEGMQAARARMLAEMDALRDAVTRDYMAEKLADLQRKQDAKAAATVAQHVDQDAQTAANGHSENGHDTHPLAATAPVTTPSAGYGTGN